MAKLMMLISLFFGVFADLRAQVDGADFDKKNYVNPIIHADYSDPDIIRVGSDFYMTASSFNCVPGLPVLHSTDLVHWELINHAVKRVIPDSFFSRVQHGNGIWAPALRFHEGYFYIFWGDPDFGIFMTKTQDPYGEWTLPHLVQKGSGWIDPCPLWDSDGKAYLVHAFAGSRAEIKSVLIVHEMEPDGSALKGEGILVYDGHDYHTTIEGPKFYKRGGYYYIFAPAGGVATGWQTVLRAPSVFGPYEIKTVMEQGSTAVNGPHQGGWVELASGESWFVHFQDKGVYGRVVHLQPMVWEDDWCVIGEDPDGDGVGTPVLSYRRPALPMQVQPGTSVTADSFQSIRMGLQWQWHSNPEPTWGFLRGPVGKLRLYAVELPEGGENLWQAGNLLLQKFPAPSFQVTTRVEFFGATRNDPSEKAGLLVMGMDYAYLAICVESGERRLQQVVCRNADAGGEEEVLAEVPLAAGPVFFRVDVEEGGACRFSYSQEGNHFEPVGATFFAREGKWIGAKVGLFALREGATNDAGYADFDWFRVDAD